MVLIHHIILDAAGGWDQVIQRDPLLAAFDRDYGPPTEAPGYLALR